MTVCATDGHITITYSTAKVIHVELDGVRWCFGCRKHLLHVAELWAEPEPSYYEPHWTLSCSRCHKDKTQFPQGW